MPSRMVCVPIISVNIDKEYSCGILDMSIHQARVFVIGDGEDQGMKRKKGAK